MTRGQVAFWRAQSLRFQIAALICGTGLFLVLLNAALLSIFLHEYVLEHEGSALEARVTNMASCTPGSSVVAMLAGNRPLIGAEGPVFLVAPYEHALVIDRSGAVLIATPMELALRAFLRDTLQRYLSRNRSSLSAAPEWHALDGQILAEVAVQCRAAAATSNGSSAVIADVRGGLLLSEDRAIADNAWRRLLERILVIGALAIVVAVFIGLVIGERTTRAIRSVTRAARAIAAGDWRRRVIPDGPAEMREMSGAFNYMVEEVVTQRRVERDLFANISHELASPLGLIRGYSEALVDNVITGEPDRIAAIHAILTETIHLERLTADMLDLALLESGQVNLHLEEVPVRELLMGLGQRLTPVMRKSGLTLPVVAPEDLPVLRTDGQRLEQILVNLLTNAARHTPSGGTIILAAGGDASGVSITVQDNGSGIPAEELPRIWERFYQVEKARDRRGRKIGVGLGLAICRGTARLLRGSINVESTVGVGTTFTLRLPLRIEDQNAPERLSGM